MDKRVIGEAALLGTAAGMRTTVPLAALALGFGRRRITGAAGTLAAVGELIYDKLPQASERTAPPSLAVRLFSGGLAGGIAARVLGGSTPLGAATGALAALASTFLFHRLRAAAARRVPPLAAAAGEDLLAIGASTAAIRNL